MSKSIFNAEKMYTYIRGFAAGANMPETTRALGFAREKHTGQFRKSGEPYIIHPLTMACNALSLGIRDDGIIAATLLHDVCEDCGVGLAELPVNETIKNIVRLLTFDIRDGETKEIAKIRYYNAIAECREASITKIIDRCHNVSSMAGTFSEEKLRAYIEETRHFVLPLLKKAKARYPEYSDILFALKYHMVSVVDSIEAAMLVYRPKEKPASDGKDGRPSD